MIYDRISKLLARIWGYISLSYFAILKHTAFIKKLRAFGIFFGASFGTD